MELAPSPGLQARPDRGGGKTAALRLGRGQDPVLDLRETVEIFGKLERHATQPGRKGWPFGSVDLPLGITTAVAASAVDNCAAGPRSRAEMTDRSSGRSPVASVLSMNWSAA